MKTPPTELRRFEALLDVVKSLRSPDGGCPWDLKQTHQTLTKYAIEETHELVEAIERGSLPHMVEELGDVLLQVVLHAEIGRQAQTFAIEDVIEAINTKMISRHPHVFGDASATTPEEVLSQWDQLKANEKAAGAKSIPSEDTFGVPLSLPALQRSQKIGEKTKKTRFDWQNAAGVVEKLQEELAELQKAMAKEGKPEQTHEIGDVLFTVVQLARHLDIDAEQSLRLTNQRFERRYNNMMALAQRKKLNFDTLTEAEKENLWREAKLLERYS
jgi:tetrapyrrole methylase family protein/MazG family protein